MQMYKVTYSQIKGGHKGYVSYTNRETHIVETMYHRSGALLEFRKDMGRSVWIWEIEKVHKDYPDGRKVTSSEYVE